MQNQIMLFPQSKSSCRSIKESRSSLKIGLLKCVFFVLLIFTSGNISELNAQRHVRKGFILGLGLGGGINSRSVPGYPDGGETFGALNTDFKIGGSPSEQIMIYWTSKAAFFNHPSDFSQSLVSFAVAGVGGTYFLQPESPSLFFNAMAGYANHNVFDENGSYYGLGMGVGFGYEFAQHWLAEMNIVYGNPDFSGLNYNLVGLRMSVSWLLY